jgi:hypothetical protein
MRIKLVSLPVIFAIFTWASAPQPTKGGNQTGTAEAVAVATDAYIYGYPLITLEITRRVSTNVSSAGESRAPMGQFARFRTYPAVSDHTVAAPNADTLYTLAWVDVSKEPWVLGIPDMKDRYYLTPMLSGWTDVFQAPGKRTTGDRAQKYVITGPGWKGTLPTGLTQYKSPTGMVWIVGRIYCTGTPEDYKEVHAQQDQFSLVPLSSYGKPYTPPAGHVDPSIDMKTAVRDQVNAMDVSAYFNLLAALMKGNPPAPADAPIVARMAKIGIVPGQPFDMGKFSPQTAAALQGVPKDAFRKIMAHFHESKRENGWVFSTEVGFYGTSYLQRAMVSAIGPGGNRPQDAVYPVSEVDADGRPYDGAANKYVMHFDKGQMPPAQGFWSLTMYDAGYFFVPNPLNRYNLSSRSKFQENQDGSVDLYLQKDSPGQEKEANWLPAPNGKFILMLRLFWPREKPPSIIDGTWKIPPVKKVQ